MTRLFLAAFMACLPASVVGQEPQGIAVPPDMACVEGPRAVQWSSVKKRFRGLFESVDGPFVPVATDDLVSALKASVADVEAVRGLSTDADAVNECGFGKLFIQLLSLVTIDEPAGIAQFFQEHPQVASPVMTMLLDIPWVSMAQSGWPFLGIMAQINYQKTRVLGPVLNVNAIDGLASEAITQYFELMTGAQKSGDMLAMAQASQMYLSNPPPESPYATMTAMATQSAISMDINERLKNIQALQDAFKQVLTSAQELDIALTIRWPMWGFLHASVDVFADV